MYTDIPAISGKRLIKLLKKDGWTERDSGRAQHGIALVKQLGGRMIVAIIPDTRASLPKTTLYRILSVKQTGIGKNGLIKLLNTYGI